MPIIKIWEGLQDGWKERYNWHEKYCTTYPSIHSKLKEWRKEYINYREYFLSCVKDLPSKEDKSFFGKEAKRMLKLQRACTLMLPYFGKPDKEQEVVPSRLWPLDLAEQLDEVTNRIGLELYEEHTYFNS